jgi:hypothetical protein
VWPDRVAPALDDDLGLAQSVEDLAVEQRVAFYELVASSFKAGDTLGSACPAETALTPVGRMKTMRRRLAAVRAAIAAIRPGAVALLRGARSGAEGNSSTRPGKHRDRPSAHAVFSNQPSVAPTSIPCSSCTRRWRIAS